MKAPLQQMGTSNEKNSSFFSLKKGSVQNITCINYFFFKLTKFDNDFQTFIIVGPIWPGFAG